MKRTAALPLVASLVLMLACSSSTSGSDSGTDSGNPADSGKHTHETGSTCLALGGDCSGSHLLDCCLSVGGPPVDCATRAGAFHATCSATTGAVCMHDTDCQYGVCGKSGKCELVALAGACKVSEDCLSPAPGGTPVICNKAGICVVFMIDAGSGG